jgi:mannose-6-phosphate isomerase-like protein (cupin superfamily)
MFLFRGDIMLEELRGVAEGSLDRVVMEKTARAAVVPCDIGWSDIGSWPSLWRFTQSRRDLSPVEESWGRYTVFARGEGFQVKEIVINPLSHFPSRHRKHWIVMAGHARVICGDEVFDLDVNGSAEVASGARLENPGTEPLHIIEVG